MFSIGEIQLFAGEIAPRGWYFCQGQTLRVADNSALFSIIGGDYGGDNTRTFQLPNLAPLHESDGGQTSIQYIICASGIFPDLGGMS